MKSIQWLAEQTDRQTGRLAPTDRCTCGWVDGLTMTGHIVVGRHMEGRVRLSLSLSLVHSLTGWMVP